MAVDDMVSVGDRSCCTFSVDKVTFLVTVGRGGRLGAFAVGIVAPLARATDDDEWV